MGVTQNCYFSNTFIAFTGGGEDLEGDRRRVTSEKLGNPVSIVCKTSLQTVCIESQLFNPAGCNNKMHVTVSSTCPG